MARKLGLFLAHGPGKLELRTSNVREASRQIRQWHNDAITAKERWLVFVSRARGKSTLYIGVGDKRGMYIGCSYYAPDWGLDLIAVGPGGLRGRRKFVEYDYDGNPHEAPVQCLLPVERAHEVIEAYLSRDALPLIVEWICLRALDRFTGR